MKIKKFNEHVNDSDDSKILNLIERIESDDREIFLRSFPIKYPKHLKIQVRDDQQHYYDVCIDCENTAYHIFDDYKIIYLGGSLFDEREINCSDELKKKLYSLVDAKIKSREENFKNHIKKFID